LVRVIKAAPKKKTMARYTGPKTRIARKFKEAILGPDKWMERKPHSPGQHGPTKRRKKESEYAVQLQEKQKAKYTYGILERQFEKMFHTAASKKGITGEVLLQLCEARLDNTVFRLGVAPTRRAARQLVSHGHITVDGQVVNVASYTLRRGHHQEPCGEQQAFRLARLEPDKHVRQVHQRPRACPDPGEHPRAAHRGIVLQVRTRSKQTTHAHP
jgi:ribosomal protein S4